jgi:penicillin amidase
LFLEELRRDGDAWHYRQGDAWLPCTVRREEIRVKKSAPVVEEVLATSRGPIINPVLTDTPEAISLRAVWLDPLPLDGWLSAMAARGVAQFRDSFRHWPGFPMNLVYADVTGKTGWQLVGQLPIRKRGNGMIPLPGWDDRNGWQPDLVPFDQMPFVEDPPEGVFATANNRPMQKDGGPFLGEDFLEHYRHQVIVEELATREKWDLAGAASIQMCVRSIPWREVRDIVLAVDPRRLAEEWMQDLLRDWEGDLASDSSAATIFQLFLAMIALDIAEVKAPKCWQVAVGKGPSVLNPCSFFAYRRSAHVVNLLKEKPPGWFPDGWESAIDDAMRRATNDAVELRHAEWGHARPLVLQHLLMSLTPLRFAFNLGPFAIGGDEHTPHHASNTPLDPLGPVRSMPNLRATIDVGEWSNSRFVLAGGQSGNPMSPHYADLLPFWQRGDGVPIAFTADEVRAATVTELRLSNT